MNVRDDCGGLECHAVVINAGSHGLHLLNEIRDVVRQAQEVLFVSAWADLAGNGQLTMGVLVAFAAQPFDGQHVIARDAVVKNDAPVDLKVISGF